MSHPLVNVPQGGPVTPAHCHLHLQMEGLHVAQVTSVSGQKRSVLPFELIPSLPSRVAQTSLLVKCETLVLPPKEERVT